MTDDTPSPPPLIPAATVQADGWDALRRFTDARIALGRAGHGLPTAAHLAFQAAHAQARDAVHAPLDTAALVAAMAERGWPALCVASAAPDRATHLTRPDLGRRLDDASQAALSCPAPAPDVVLVVGDGLSGSAVARNALPLLDALVPRLTAAGRRLGPILVATQARVALGDHAGELLQARAAVVLIGERPGLSAADSLGLYLTWMPRVGRVDAERNCISNVRAGGLSPPAAAEQAAALIEGMFRHHMAGVALSARLAGIGDAVASAPPPALPPSSTGGGV